MDVIILGGRRDYPWPGEGVENKTLLRIGSTTILERVISAFKGVGPNRIILTGDDTIGQDIRNQVDIFIEGNEIWDKIEKAINSSKSDEFLVCSGDIPLIEGEMVELLFKYCRESKADLIAFFSLKDTVEEKYPFFSKTYFPIKDRRIKIGNLLFINRRAYQSIREMMVPLIKGRKSRFLPLFYFQLAGFKLAFKYFTRSLSIKDLEVRFFGLTSLEGKGILFPYPEIALDVDRMKDLVAVRRVLGLSN